MAIPVSFAFSFLVRSFSRWRVAASFLLCLMIASAGTSLAFGQGAGDAKASVEEQSAKEEKVYLQAHKEIKEKFTAAEEKVTAVVKELGILQQHVTNWRNATRRSTAQGAQNAISDMGIEFAEGLRDDAIKKLFGDDYGPKLINMMQSLEKATGRKLGVPSRAQMEKLLETAVGREQLYGYMYNISAIERTLRKGGYFDKLNKIKASFDSAKQSIDEAGKMLEFVAVFDPNNVDKDAPISRLKALGGVLGYMKQFTKPVPGLGDLIDFYISATEEFSTALSDLDKKLREARDGSICGSLQSSPQSRALAQFLVGKRNGDCFNFYQFYAAEALLAPTKAWRHAGSQDVFLFSPDGSYAYLTGTQYLKLARPFEALKASGIGSWERLARIDYFMKLASVASEKGREEAGNRTYVPGHTLCGQYADWFGERNVWAILEKTGTVDLARRFVSPSGSSSFRLSAASRDSLIGLCTYDQDMRRSMTSTYNRFRDRVMVTFDIYADDRGARPKLTAFRLNDSRAILDRSWISRAPDFVRIPAIVSAGKRVQYRVLAEDCEEKRFATTFSREGRKTLMVSLKRKKDEQREAEDKKDDGGQQDAGGQQDDGRGQDQGGTRDDKGTATGPNDGDDALDDLINETEANGETASSGVQSGDGQGQTGGGSGASAVQTDEPQGDVAVELGEEAGDVGSDGQGTTTETGDSGEAGNTPEETGEDLTEGETPAEDQTAAGNGIEIPSVGTGVGGIEVTAVDANDVYLGDRKSISVPTPEWAPLSMPEANDSGHASVVIVSPVDEEILPDSLPQYHWQSEPPIRFEPPVSSDGRTVAIFDRTGSVKIWADAVKGEQKQRVEAGTFEAKVPQFAIQFTPPSAAVAGSEISARLTSSPMVDEEFITVSWEDPPEQNLVSSQRSGMTLQFKGDAGEVVPLSAAIANKATGDALTTVEASYSVATLSFTIKAKRRGPPVKVWDADRKGLVEAGADQFYVGEAIDLTAEFAGGKTPDDIRWRWQVDAGSSLSNEIATLPTLTRSEPGSAQVSLSIRDRNGKEMAKADTTVSFLEKTDEPGGSKTSSKGDKPKDQPKDQAVGKDGKTADGKDGRSGADGKEAAGNDGKSGSMGTDSGTQSANSTGQKKPPDDWCAPGTNQHTAASQMWATGLQAVGTQQYERAFAHFEASLAICPDETRQKLFDSLKAKVGQAGTTTASGGQPGSQAATAQPPQTQSQSQTRSQPPVQHPVQTPVQRPSPTTRTPPPDPCGTGGSRQKAAADLWTQGLGEAKATRYEGALERFRQSLALCPDAKRAQMVDAMAKRLEQIAEQKRQQEEANRKAANPCAEGGQLLQPARQQWQQGLATIKGGKPATGLQLLRNSLSLCPDAERSKQLKGLETAIAKQQDVERAKAEAQARAQEQAQKDAAAAAQSGKAGSLAPGSVDPFDGFDVPKYDPNARTPEKATSPFAVAPTPEATRGASDEYWINKANEQKQQEQAQQAQQAQQAHNGQSGGKQIGSLNGSALALYKGQVSGLENNEITIEVVGNRLSAKVRINFGREVDTGSFTATLTNGEFETTFNLYSNLHPGKVELSLRVKGRVENHRVSGVAETLNIRTDPHPWSADRVGGQGSGQSMDDIIDGIAARIRAGIPSVKEVVKEVPYAQ
ncbi:hypothetical protein [uncultured Cohaesibacter sp.]|uniref:hypothetical protein n=1 Tax=uncultured Cohaesibacter sp. TaxID=1002546 RepID=UPI0029C662B3|nr:hypothetical protein [uncultured Cohaesibacter sp.]